MVLSLILDRFPWVSLQLEQLFECRSAPDIMDRLGRLPLDLDKSYTEIYERNTGKLGPHAKARVERMFVWALAAIVKPTSDTVIEAIRYSTDGNEGEGCQSQLCSICANICYSSTPNRIVGSSHMRQSQSGLKVIIGRKHKLNVMLQKCVSHSSYGLTRLHRWPLRMLWKRKAWTI